MTERVGVSGWRAYKRWIIVQTHHVNPYDNPPFLLRIFTYKALFLYEVPMCRQRLLSAIQSIDWWRHFVSENRCIRVILFAKRSSVDTCVVRRLHQNFCLGRRRKFPLGFSSDLQRDLSMPPRRKSSISAEKMYYHRGDEAFAPRRHVLVYLRF